MPRLPTVCVIGAGSSGIAAVKELHERGFAVRLLRGVGPRRRQLGVREPQRDVGRLPLAAHQHVARADGLRGAADAGGVSRLPAPHPHRGVLRRLRRPLRAARPDHVRDARHPRGPARRRRLGRHGRAGRDAHVRRPGRRQRPPLGPARAGAAVPRARPLRRGPDALARVHGRGPGAVPRPPRRRARDGELGDGHRGRVVVPRAPHVPGRPARGVDHPQVPVRPSARHADRRRARALRGAPALPGLRAAADGRADGALRPARRRTTRSAPPTRRSPTTSSAGSPTARSRRSRTSPSWASGPSASPTAARPRPT